MGRLTVVVFVVAFLLTVIPAFGLQEAGAADRWELRVCADPNNLPYSNERLEGFENRIARLAADKLDAELTFFWWPQRRAFSRESLREGHCDVVIGVPDQLEPLQTTLPYYRTSYVFAYRADRDFEVESFDDPVLHELRIGVQLVGEEYANTPPAHALGRRGHTDNLIGYSVLGDYNEPDPHRPIMDAVVSGEVDVAVVWGPIAGYYAKQQSVPLKLVPVSPEIDYPFLPMTFSISMGVRRPPAGGRDDPFVELLNDFIDEHIDEIEQILADYGVPILP